MRMHIHPPKADPKAVIQRLREQNQKAMEPPKFCKDCHWHAFKEIPTKERVVFKHFCTFPPLLDKITGEPSNAAKNRNTETLCGSKAVHFAQRQKADRPNRG